MQTKHSSPRTICILRLSAIGDVCHAVATVQAIQKCWPDAQITWIIGKIEYQLLQGLKAVEFIVFDKKAGLKGYQDLRAHLKNHHFDILLHMQVALRASLASCCIRATEKWGFDRKRAREGQWLFCNHQIAAQNEPHVADGFLGFAKAIGVTEDHQLQWQMPIAEVDIEWQQRHLSCFGKYVVIAPAASKAERNWLAESYADFAKHADDKGFKVVICGGPTEMENKLAADIISYCDFEIINLVAKTTLKQLLVILREAQMLLAPDSGPAHMAVTVNTPVIGLYVHSNPKRTGPYGYLDYVVSRYEQVLEQQTKSSSKENRWGKRVKGENLMQLIDLTSVLAAFDRMVVDFDL